MTVTFVDCQGFAGGFTLGAVQAGLKLVAKKEDGPFGVLHCESNRHLLGDGWRVDTRGPSHWEPETADVVLGNPSCGGFSIKSATGTKNSRGADARANDGMKAFVKYAAACRPQVAVFECVQGIRTLPEGLNLLRQLHYGMEYYSGLEYTVTHVRHSAHTLGGPGLRPRYFWVASRVPFGVEHRSTANVPTLEDVVGDLESQPLSMEARPYASPPTWWSRERRSPAGAVDGHACHDSPKSGRLADLLAGPFTWEPGEYLEQFVLRYERAGLPLPPSQARIHVGIGQMIRWEYDRPARTVVRDTTSVAIHPVLDRFLTQREVLRVMGYPDTWLTAPLAARVSKQELQYGPGRGITVDCGQWIATWIREAIEGRPGSHRGERLGEREWDVDVTYGRDDLRAVEPWYTVA